MEFLSTASTVAAWPPSPSFFEIAVALVGELRRVVVGGAHVAAREPRRERARGVDGDTAGAEHGVDLGITAQRGGARRGGSRRHVDDLAREPAAAVDASRDAQRVRDRGAVRRDEPRGLDEVGAGLDRARGGVAEAELAAATRVEEAAGALDQARARPS